jgi:hypothetical protein
MTSEEFDRQLEQAINLINIMRLEVNLRLIRLNMRNMGAEI